MGESVNSTLVVAEVYHVVAAAVAVTVQVPALVYEIVPLAFHEQYDVLPLLPSASVVA